MAWNNLKKILCVRPDNMGDLLMTAPAIAALKATFNCSISLLTSSMAQAIAAYLPNIDEVITWDVPWVKGARPTTPEAFEKIVGILRQKHFDGAIIFTVFSQNPLPTALMLTLAGIPNRLAYCRENPYHLLSHWVPEKEPYLFLRHQTRRDLDLVRSIGAVAPDEKITIRLPANYEQPLGAKLADAGVDAARPWLIMHPGASEKKREYPHEQWIELGKKIVGELQHQVLITGVKSERALTGTISRSIGPEAHDLAGALALEEFITLIRCAPLLISVNTGSVHLAAAVRTKVIVLYAMTNPQHTPWRSVGKVFPFSIAEELRSQNEVLQFVQQRYFGKAIRHVSPSEILKAARDMLIEKSEPLIEELVFNTSDTVTLTHEQHFVFP